MTTKRTTAASALTALLAALLTLATLSLGGCLPSARNPVLEASDMSAPEGYPPPKGFIDLTWGMDLQDVTDVAGPLKLTFGDLISQESLSDSDSSTASRNDTVDAFGHGIRGVFDPSCAAAPTPADALHHGCVIAEEPPTPNDTFYALAEYQPTDPKRARLELGDSGVVVQVFYVFAAVHLAQTTGHIVRHFSSEDLRLYGVRLMFAQPDSATAPDVRKRMLLWLVKHYGKPLDYKGPDPGESHSAGPDLDGAGSGEKDNSFIVQPPGADEPLKVIRPRFVAEEDPPSTLDIEQYRWCGPSRYNEDRILCKAAVTFVLDRRTRRAVLFLMEETPYHYFAARIRYARNVRHDSSLAQLTGRDRYYGLLFIKPERYISSAEPVICEGCGPESYSLSEAVRKRFRPHVDE